MARQLSDPIHRRKNQPQVDRMKTLLQIIEWTTEGRGIRNRVVGKHCEVRTAGQQGGPLKGARGQSPIHRRRDHVRRSGPDEPTVDRETIPVQESSSRPSHSLNARLSERNFSPRSARVSAPMGGYESLIRFMAPTALAVRLKPWCSTSLVQLRRRRDRNPWNSFTRLPGVEEVGPSSIPRKRHTP